MRKFALTTLCVLVFGFSVFAQGTIDAEGSSTVTTVLWFYQTEITLKTSGDLSITGSINLNDETLTFSADGVTFGSGISNMETLATLAWNLFEASGSTENGTPVSVRGGTTISSSETDLTTCSLGSGTGDFFFVLEFLDRRLYVHGRAEGTATGIFVAPDEPSTMQIEGTGTFAFQGEVLTEDVATGLGSEDALLLQLPWDSSTWPEELHTQLVDLILNRTPEEE
jgi:hypothetical protein